MSHLRSAAALFLFVCPLHQACLGAEEIKLGQAPALSPDGRTMAFAWRGDLWTVPVTGGTARRLTIHPATEGSPCFSPDGTRLAFVSDREGSRQVYIMPAAGGSPEQKTWHTEGYDIEDWLPDGQNLLVTLNRDHTWMRDSRSARLAVLDLTVRRAEKVLLDDAAADARLSPDGARALFVREGEVWWRQGYKGSRAGQIWMLDRATGACSKVRAESTETRWPLWKPDGKGCYYVANRDGTYNLWEHDFASGAEKQITFYKEDSVVFPAISRDGGVLAFRHRFDYYRWSPGSGLPPEKIAIQCDADDAPPAMEKKILERASHLATTADGLQMAFIADGDVWVMDTELKEPRQVTHTPEEERDVTFAPDGKSLWFVSDAGGCDIWKAEPENARRFWWDNSSFKLTRITQDETTEAAIKFLPGGKHVAWLGDRGDLWIANADGKEKRVLVKSWSRPSFDFSPDGKWIVYAVSDAWFNSDIWLMPVDGTAKPFNLSRHPNNDYSPVWSPDGKMIAWTGQREDDEVDIHYAWLRPEDEDQSRRDRTRRKAIEKMLKAASSSSRTSGSSGSSSGTSSGSATAAKSTPAPNPAAPANATPAPKPPVADEPKTAGPSKPATTTPKPTTPTPPVEVKVDLEGIHDRVHRISIPKVSEFGLLWSPDSKKLAYFTLVDGKRSTHTVEFPDDLKPKMLSQTGLSQARWLKDDQIVGLSEGVPTYISAKGGSAVTHRFRAMQETDRAGRQRAIFEQCWRVMNDQYYDERLGNRDWRAIREKYAPMAAAAPDLKAVVEVVHLMLGELNGSHLGFSVNSTRTATAGAWRDETAHLGLRFDPEHAGPGWKIKDVIHKSPASQKQKRLLPGEIVLRVDGREVRPGMDSSEVLNGPLDRDITLKVQGADGKERDVMLRPISYSVARGLLYEQWIRDNREAVEKASAGNLGYLHISAMNEASFNRFQEELYAAGAGKQGLIIDVRENGGGSTADHLLTALMQPRHAYTIPRGGEAGYPQDRIVYATWDKPVVVLCNQNSYSNAEIFSHAIKTLKRGRVVGVPTAGGVISTGAAAIMDVGTLRLPFRGWYGIETGIDMELNGAVPDIVVWPQPGDLAKGKDDQLTTAISELTKEVEAYKAKSALPRAQKASERW